MPGNNWPYLIWHHPSMQCLKWQCHENSKQKLCLVRMQYFFFSGLFDIRTIESTAAQIFAAKPLVGKYGNYSLVVQAQDRGFPPNSVTSQVEICVSDFNDHAPEFVSPSVNLTIRVPEVSICLVWHQVINTLARVQYLNVILYTKQNIVVVITGNNNIVSFLLDMFTVVIVVATPIYIIRISFKCKKCPVYSDICIYFGTTKHVGATFSWL